jgi:hypothetical protein
MRGLIAIRLIFRLIRADFLGSNRSRIWVLARRLAASPIATAPNAGA